MPYTLAVTFVDIPGLYSAASPPMSGTISPVPPAAGPPETVVPAAASPTTFSFPQSTPPAPCSVLILDTAAAGDVFRSGVVASLPPTPGNVIAWIAPSVRVPFTSIASPAAVAPPASALPIGVIAAVSVASGGVFIPLTMTITGTIAATSLLVTVTGTLTARVWYFWIRVYTFVATFVVVPASSGDADVPGRILSIRATAPTLVATGVPGFIAARLAPAIAGVAASHLESTLNTTITSMVNSSLGSLGRRLTPTAVICAQHVGVVPSAGIVLQLIISDLFDVGTVPLAKIFAVAVTPHPQPGPALAYMAKVTDAATHAAVPHANVTLHNFAANGDSIIDGPHQTNANGQVMFNADLHPRIVPIPGKGVPREEGSDDTHVRISPTLTVELIGFNPQTVTLLI
jgi:hypothetical protein